MSSTDFKFTAKPNRICKECSIPFHAPPSAGGIYCSQKCSGIAVSRNKIAKSYLDSSNWFNCCICNKRFKNRSCDRMKDREHLNKYCSKACHHKGMSIYPRVLTCANCLKEYPMGTVHTIYCSRKCYWQHGGVNKFKCGGSTDIEKIMADTLTMLKYDFIQDYKVGIYYIDFYIPTLNVGIECDSAFWHDNRKDKDKKRDAVLWKEHGIRMARFTDKQIKSKSLVLFVFDYLALAKGLLLL